MIHQQDWFSRMFRFKINKSKNKKMVHFIGFFNHPFFNILHAALGNAGFFFTLRAK